MSYPNRALIPISVLLIVGWCALAASAQQQVQALRVAQVGPNLTIEIDAAPGFPFDQAAVLIQLDGASAGYEPADRTGSRFTYCVHDSGVARFIGKDNHDWKWVPVGRTRTKVDPAAGAARCRIELPIKLIGVEKIQLGVWAISKGQKQVHPVAADDALQTIQLKTDPAIERDLAAGPPRADRNLPPRQRFRQAKNYYLYYGAQRVPELSRYDIAVIHTPAMTPADVRTLNGLGVVTIGYITVGEDDELRVGNGKGPDGKASWYLDRDHDGKPDENGIWKSWYANASDPGWRADRLALAHKLADEYGFEGFFLDTIEIPDIYPQARPGMIQLVEELRREFPDKVILPNRAFSLLKEPAIASSIDGILYESFSSHYDWNEKQYIRFSPSQLDDTRGVIEKYVRPVMKQYPKFRVLALDYTEPDDHEWIQTCFDRAVTFGFLPCVAPITLDDVYDTANVVGHADEKYLRKLATPESMRITLQTTRNGFPAGTIVEPSSCFPDYNVAPVVDGIEDRGKLPWQKAAWASAEEPEEHSLTFFLGQSTIAHGLVVRYTLASSKYRIEVRRAGQPDWNTVAKNDLNQKRQVEIALPGSEPIDAIRIVQPAGAGNKDRPNLMWIEQVELRP